MSYALGAVTIPALLALPSASSASSTFNIIHSRAVGNLRKLAGFSTLCFLTAYSVSPRGFRHPYLLWTSLAAVASGSFDLFINFAPPEKSISERKEQHVSEKGKKKMESSYEILGDNNSDGTGSASDMDEEEVNGEQIRSEMIGFKSAQAVRFGLSGVAFILSIVGLWGDATL